MPSLRFTPARIAALAPIPGRSVTVYTDDTFPNFGVRVSARSKSYIVRYGAIERTIGRTDLYTLDEAREKVRDALRQIKGGEAPASKLTLRKALELWADGKANLTEATKKIRRRQIENHLGDWLDVPLRSITAHDVIARHKAITDDVKRASSGKRDGRGAANNVIVSFNAVWSYAEVIEPSLPQSPGRALSKVGGWHPRRSKPLTMKPGDLRKFFEALKTHAYSDAMRAYLGILAFTGCRRTELALLTWGDVRDDRLQLRKTKRSKPRDVPITAQVRAILDTLPRGNPDTLVFPPTRSDAKRLGESSTLRRTGIVTGSHQLRKWYISRASEGNFPDRIVDRLVGQKSKSTGGLHYTFPTWEALSEWAQKIADELDRDAA